MNGEAAPSLYVLGAGLVFCGLLFLLSFFICLPSRTPAQQFAWAPGYWENSPVIGLVRIVPLAGREVINPIAAVCPANLLIDALPAQKEPGLDLHQQSKYP